MVVKKEDEVYRSFIQLVSRVKKQLLSQPNFFFDGENLCYGNYVIVRQDSGLYCLKLNGVCVYDEIFSIMTALLICRYETRCMAVMVKHIVECDRMYAKYSMDCRFMKAAITRNADAPEELIAKYEHYHQTALLYHNKIHKYCDKLLQNGK